MVLVQLFQRMSDTKFITDKSGKCAPVEKTYDFSVAISVLLRLFKRERVHVVSINKRVLVIMFSK